MAGTKSESPVTKTIVDTSLLRASEAMSRPIRNRVASPDVRGFPDELPRRVRFRFGRSTLSFEDALHFAHDVGWLWKPAQPLTEHLLHKLAVQKHRHPLNHDPPKRIRPLNHVGPKPSWIMDVA